MMTTFKAGDRVRTVKEYSDIPVGASGSVVESKAFPSLYVRVVLNDYPYYETYGAWPFEAHELELIEETPDPRDDALDRIHDLVRCAYGRRSDAVRIVETDLPEILRETGRM